MKKIKWGDLIAVIICLYSIVFLTNEHFYDDFIRHPLEHGSGTSSSMAFYFLLYKIDQCIGKIGIMSFFILGFLFFLYHFIKTNIFTFSDMYRNWKEKKDE